MDTVAPPTRSSRLGIIHLLGWMLGCGVVLAIVRVGSPANAHLSVQLRELGLGLAYGTAISGLVLFVWRWRTASGPGPTQPGHWLILFCGIGFLVDVGLTGVLEPLRMLRLMRWDVGFFHEAAGWWIATLVGCAVLGCLRGASRAWIAATTGIVLALAINAVASTVAVVATAQGTRGSWPWYVVTTTRLASSCVALPPIWAAVVNDALRHTPRDWLHVGGVGAVSLLACADFAVTLYWVMG